MKRRKTTYKEDVAELRVEFEKIDKKDPEAIRKWFEEKHYLTTNDHAQIAGKSLSYIRILKRLAGIRGKVPANIPPPPKSNPSAGLIEAPDDWDSEKWLRKVAELYSLRQIARACGVSLFIIYSRMVKYGIKERLGCKPKNKYCTKLWCWENYIEKELTQAQCAKAAGICQQTFSNWLNRFDIPVRTVRETHRSHTNTQLWVRELLANLKEQPTVRTVFLRNDHVHVRFMNFFWETYYVDHRTGPRRAFSYAISKADSKITKVPAVMPEFETEFEEILGEDGIIQAPHIAINRRELNNATFLERRLAIHEYCRQIIKRKWIWPEYPQHIIDQEWEKVRNYRPDKYMEKGLFSAKARIGPVPIPGRKLIEHFFDLSDYHDVFRSPRNVMRLLDELLELKHLNFNFHNMLKTYSCGQAQRRIPKRYPRLRLSDPAVYAVIFKRLGIGNSILDVNPGFGNRAIASALVGLDYFTIPDYRFAAAIDRGFHDFIGLKYTEWAEHKVDWLLYDNNFGIPDMNNVKELMKYAKRMMVFVPHSYKSAYETKYKPKSIVRIKSKWYQKAPDYLFIW